MSQPENAARDTGRQRLTRGRDAGRSRIDVSYLLRGTRKNVVGLLGALIALYIVFGIKAPNFLTVSNQLSIALNTSFLAIPAWAMTLVIGCAEIDMSTGPAVAFAGVFLGLLVTNYGIPLLDRKSTHLNSSHLG